ncbi:MAG: type II secretion system protein GspG [Phycisphaeraceae bacterium]
MRGGGRCGDGHHLLSQWADDGAAYSWPVRRTHSFLDNTRDDVEQYRKEHGKLPDTLADLEEVGYLKDGWKRPFQYVPHGDTYELYSLGRDGKPGGKGIDADIDLRGNESSEVQPTLYQFVFEMESVKGLVNGSIVAGFFTFLIALLPTLRRDAKPEHWTSLILKLFITVVVCTIMAGWMAILDIPSGH